MTNRVSQYISEDSARPASVPAGFEAVPANVLGDSRRLSRTQSIHELAWLLAQMGAVGGPEDVARWLGEA